VLDEGARRSADCIGCKERVDDGKARILYLGDSLGVGTAPHLEQVMPGVPIDDDTRVGRTSTEGLAVFGLGCVQVTAS